MAVVQTKLLSACTLRHKLLNLGLRMCSTGLNTASFRYEELEVSLSANLRPKPDDRSLKFGHEFTDHMLVIDWSAKYGWGNPLICAVQDLRIHPAAKVFHYAIELFEGMKAFRCVDDRVRIFRPMENMERMRRTAARLGLPDFDGTELCKLIKRLIKIDQDWVPSTDQCSLYIRPCFIGTEPTLGVTSSNTAKIFVLIGPVGPYFPTGFKPVTLMADPQYVRAWKGGCGAFKMGSNYAPTIKVQDEAERRGCQQVLWLYGDQQWMTEVGTMNLFVYMVNKKGEKELVTPPLDGLILPGITRKSLLQLANEWTEKEFLVSERVLSMKEFTEALSDKRVLEVFGCGTACNVAPVEKIKYEGQDLLIPTMRNAKLFNRFHRELSNIHYGRTPHHWMSSIEDGFLRTSEQTRTTTLSSSSSKGKIPVPLPPCPPSKEQDS